ncbi:MAG: hypothetical protein U0704_01775 [Candidatus Eisenbacteria bacterium]
MRTALRLTGADALPLLHRLTSNALADLAPGEWRATLFCDFRGRLLHRALVAHAADGALWLLRDDADGAELAAFVDRFVFREDVRIEDRSGAPLPDLGLATPLPPTLDEPARIAAGLPRHGHEIAEAFTAYEVALGSEVHLSKGCYTGQEALQRLVTYDSARRRLARVRGTGAVPAVPAELTSAGEPAGVLTSAIADGPDRWVGLAPVRRELLDGCAALALGDGRTAEIAHVFFAGQPQGRDAKL